MRILSAITLAADPTVALAPGTKQYIDAGDTAAVAYSRLPVGTAASTVAAGNDSRITGAEQAANKGASGGYAPLVGTLVPVANLPGATTSVQGILQLAGDLTGTASVPKLVSNVVAAKSASYSITGTDGIIVVTPSGSVPVITLPSAVTFANRRFMIKKAAGANAWPVQISSAAGTVDGQASIFIFVSGDYREFVSDGTNWIISGGTGFAVINSPTAPTNGATVTPDASIANVLRYTPAVAGWTLGNPTNGTDGQQLNIEITPSTGFTLTITGPALTTGITSPVAVANGKKCFVGLRFSGTTWYVLALTVQS